MKYSKHIDNLPAKKLYEEVKVLDPNQAKTLHLERQGGGIEDYPALFGKYLDAETNTRESIEQLNTQWIMYVQCLGRMSQNQIGLTP